MLCSLAEVTMPQVNKERKVCTMREHEAFAERALTETRKPLSKEDYRSCTGTT